MQVPRRRSQMLKLQDGEPADHRATKEAVERWNRELERLVKFERPQAAEDVNRLAQLGDFSENAEYQEAKHRLRRMNDRITRLKDRIMRAVVVENAPASDKIGIGSTVTVLMENHQRTFRLVGAHEASPLRGHISVVSPIGSGLMGRKAGDLVTVQTPQGKLIYEIVEVK